MNNLIQNTEGILRGIKLATDAIRPTYGNHGTNVAIRCDEYPYVKVVNDAKTIVDAIKTNDRDEEIGLFLYKELMDKQDSLSGDGRKTTAIIADTLITLGSQLDMPKIQLKHELEALIPLVEAKIDQHKRVITESEVSAVATIAGESKELGDLIGEIYQKIGKDGIIHLEPSNTQYTSYKFVEGVRFDDATYLSEAFTNQDKKAVYEKPHIMVTKRKLSTLLEINPILEMCINNGVKDLVIFADDMDSEVARSLINVHKSGMIKILIIKSPVLWKNYIFEDFAKCVGATIVEDATGINFKNFPLSALGSCGKIITDSKETILLDTKDITSHIQGLKQEGSIDSQRRIAWLTNKTVNLLLGANGETDLYYKMMKCKDAINASRLALKDGVVEGGGRCLADISKPFMFGADKGKIDLLLANALLAPIKQLIENSGLDATDYKVDETVLDASLVLKNAVRSAIGLASTALTIGVTIPFLAKTEEELRLLEVTKKAF